MKGSNSLCSNALKPLKNYTSSIVPFKSLIKRSLIDHTKSVLQNFGHSCSHYNAPVMGILVIVLICKTPRNLTLLIYVHGICKHKRENLSSSWVLTIDYM